MGCWHCVLCIYGSISPDKSVWLELICDMPKMWKQGHDAVRFWVAAANLGIKCAANPSKVQRNRLDCLKTGVA